MRFGIERLQNWFAHEAGNDDRNADARSETSGRPSQLLDAFPDYRDFRRAEDELLASLGSTIPRTASAYAERQLGLSLDAAERPDFCVESMIVEFAMIHHRPDGWNAIDRALTRWTEITPLHREVLAGLRDSWFGMFEILCAYRNRGVLVRSPVSNEEFLVSDLKLSKTALPGQFFCVRIMPVREFLILTGSSLMALQDARIAACIRAYFRHEFPEVADVRDLNRDDAARFQAGAVRIVSANEPGNILIYTKDDFKAGNTRLRRLAETYTPASPETAPSLPPRPPGRTKIGRNELCPCGSEYKYKRCCGRSLR